jgi:hypothetical protein
MKKNGETMKISGQIKCLLDVFAKQLSPMT